MIDEVTLIILFLVWIVNASLAAYIAKEKKYDGTVWFILAFLFGPLAFFATCGLPVKQDESSSN